MNQFSDEISTRGHWFQSKLPIYHKKNVFFYPKYPFLNRKFLFWIKNTWFRSKIPILLSKIPIMTQKNFTLMVFANSSETSFHNWHLSIFLGGASFRIRFKFFRFTIWSRLYNVVCWNANWISFIDLKNRVDSSVSFAWRCDRTMRFGYFGSKRMKFQMVGVYILIHFVKAGPVHFDPLLIFVKNSHWYYFERKSFRILWTGSKWTVLTNRKWIKIRILSSRSKYLSSL